ncbi:tudor domain-containing protein 1 isoform X2 [Vanacampus margaritifer]
MFCELYLFISELCTVLQNKGYAVKIAKFPLNLSTNQQLASLRMRSGLKFPPPPSPTLPRPRSFRTPFAMNNLFSPNMVRPNQPLRKPSSSPVACRFSVRPDLLSQGAGPVSPPASGNKPASPGTMKSPALLCNFCCQKGNLRCTRCKKTIYCSPLCQTRDWEGHKQICMPADPEPAKETPNQIAALPTLANKTNLLDSKHADAKEVRRVYLKDLPPIKINKGADIQASVVEFYDPGHFFLLIQNSELLETLQSIGRQLQKTPSYPCEPAYVPYVGEVCIAQFSGDLIWYRALVQKMATDKRSAHVLYIDYGNEEDVTVDRMRPLPADLELFHPCAMECCVSGVEPLDGRWSAECCSVVNQLLTGRVVTVRLVKTLENVHAHAVDIELPIGKRLSSLLIDRGFVQKTADLSPTVEDINAILCISLENFKRQSEGKDDNSWAQPPEPLTLAVGDSFYVVITHFHSPDNMIVQKVENAGVINELQQSLKQHCNQASAMQNFRPAPGTVCCAQFSEDKQWYRAKVLAYSSEERVCVGYIDFGNSEDVNIGHLRAISSSLLALPMQAIPCGLAGIQPVGEKWSEECLLALQRRVCNRILLAIVEGAHEGKALVVMLDEVSDPQDNIAELLISVGYASLAPVAGPVKGNDSPQAAAEPPALLPVCEPLTWSSAVLPTDGQLVALSAVIINNPGEFFCHIDNPADNQRMMDLEAELKQHCEADATTFEPKVGEPCCALFPGDGVWYRATVGGVSEDKVAVNFVDYGHSMEVEPSNLRSITPPLLQLPFRAIRCFLSGVEPIASDWDHKATLWFQSHAEGEKLSACALSVTKQGYGVELECRGGNVAAGLVSNHLARYPGEIAQKAHAGLSPRVEQRPGVPQAECSQMQTAKQMTTEEKSPSGPTFPTDWKTVELPINGSFKPYITAVTSPSLFYLLSPIEVDQQKLQEMMLELAAFCSSNKATLSSCTDKSKLVPGVACSAQFTADDTWYRAVVVEVLDKGVAVLYADYGNTENLPVSRILPIPERLLQLPFKVARCALTGKEHFPADWPPDVLQMYLSLLRDATLATVLSFDGFTNIVTVSLPAEKGGVHLSALILDALESQKVQSAPSQSAATKAEQMESSSSTTQPGVTPAIHEIVENTAKATESTASLGHDLEPERRLERIIERMEQMMELLVPSLTQIVETSQR